jgi:hypothetical protein
MGQSIVGFFTPPLAEYDEALLSECSVLETPWFD